MKTMIAIVLAISLAGCSTMTPGQKKFAQITAGVLIIGAIAAHGDGSNPVAPAGAVGPPPSCTPQPNGSCR